MFMAYLKPSTDIIEGSLQALLFETSHQAPIFLPRAISTQDPGYLGYRLLRFIFLRLSRLKETKRKSTCETIIRW